jgi:DNA-binding NtrC family response regulator
VKSAILLIDDEKAVLNALAEALGDLDYSLLTSTDSAEALEIVKARSPALVITDLKMPGMDGMVLLQRIREFNPNIQVIMITGHGSIEDAVAAMKKGAYDFISKPFRIAEIEATVQRAMEKSRLLQENFALRDKLRKARIPSFSEGKSPAFLELLEAARLAADSDATILVLGESGTGKEILANYIAAYSQRASQPFVAVNCAAIPENLIETELFGHKRGAFTGAHQDKKGKFQEAHGGTIFLDEIGDLPLNMQSKLLRVLQEGEATPVGGTTQKVNVRVIAATNKPLRKMTAEGLFREDLFYRLNVIALHIPSLRERMEDLPAYLAFFIAKHCRKNQREPLSVTAEALKILERYAWPGNLRELENVVERAVILSQGNQITAKVLPADLGEEAWTLSPFNFKRGMPLRQLEHLIIQDTLRYNQGDRAKSAVDLGIGQRTLYRKLLEINAEKREAP